MCFNSVATKKKKKIDLTKVEGGKGNNNVLRCNGKRLS